MLFNSKKENTREAESLGKIMSAQSSLAPVALAPLAMDNAVLIVVDMVNGFVKTGALSSPNALAINDKVAALTAACCTAGMPVACVCDTHTLSSPEFSSYPEHCLEDTAESQLTDEIAAACTAAPGNCDIIKKNSTNALLEPDFLRWLDKVGATTFILCGVCTDICVQQLAIGLKTWFNRLNRVSRVIVPADVVATYDLGEHDSSLCNTMALYNMSINGVELCSAITY